MNERFVRISIGPFAQIGLDECGRFEIANAAQGVAAQRPVDGSPQDGQITGDLR